MATKRRECQRFFSVLLKTCGEDGTLIAEELTTTDDFGLFRAKIGDTCQNIRGLWEVANGIENMQFEGVLGTQRGSK